MQNIGARIRALRLRKGMTIPVLAQLAGLSPGFVSQVETGKASLSLDSLGRIAEALGLCTGDLLEAPPAPRIVRARCRPRVRWGSSPEVEYLAPPVEANQLQGALLRLQPGGLAGGCDHAHPGQELLWVLSGTVRLLQGGHEIELTDGDSALLEGRVPHTYEAVGAEEAQFLVVTVPPAELPIAP